jgi:hypothetical protein
MFVGTIQEKVGVIYAAHAVLPVNIVHIRTGA